MSFVIGSIISINKDFYIASKIATSGWNLIDLKTGLRYSGVNFPIGSDSRAVSGNSQQQFIEHHGLSPHQFKIISTSLETLLKASKAKTKKPKIPRVINRDNRAQIIPEGIPVVAPRPDETRLVIQMLLDFLEGLIVGGIVRNNGDSIEFTMHDSFRARSAIDRVFRNIPDAMMTESPDDPGAIGIRIPKNRIHDLLGGEYGHFD